MLEFTNLVYLDLQKTGTKSIVELLRTVIKEPELRHGIHQMPQADHVTSRFHFISIRNPLGIYISLFGHGLAGRGGLFKYMQRKGQAETLYEPTLKGFNRWLEFMLDPENSDRLGDRYANLGLGGVCGPLTQRLLLLSVVDPINAISAANLTSLADVKAFFDANRIFDYHVRTEHMIDDLFLIWPEIAAHAKMRKRFRQIRSVDRLKNIMPRKNVGRKIEGLTSENVPPELRQRVRDQESLFYDTFGYDDHPKGRPPPLPSRATPEGAASQ